MLFQLRDTSRVLLAGGYPVADEFNAFYINQERPALVRADVPPNIAATAIPLVARLVATPNTAKPPATDR